MRFTVMALRLMITGVQKSYRVFFDAFFFIVILMNHFSWLTESSANNLTASVRINGDPSNRAGIVDVSVSPDGNWSRVYTFSQWQVGTVVCQQLGFGPPTYAYFGFDSSQEDGDPNFIRVECQGNEKTISDCEVKTNVTFVTVLSSMALVVNCLPPVAEEFEVALARRYEFLSEGIVLVFVDGRWGPICSSHYDDSDSLCKAVCKQMEFSACGGTYLSFTYGVEVEALPVLGNVNCRNVDILKACNYVVLKNQTCPESGLWRYGNYFYEVSCSNYYSPYDYSDVNDYAGDDFHQDRPTVIVVVSVIILSVIGVVAFLCRRARSEMATTTTTVVEEVLPGDHPDSPQETSLPPSYETAVTNEACPLAPVPAYPPQENDHLLEQTSMYPSEPVPGYPTVPITEQTLEPRMGTSGNYPPSGVMQPNLAFPLNNRTDPGLAYPPQGSITNQAQDSFVDPELPTYEAATAQQEVETE